MGARMQDVCTVSSHTLVADNIQESDTRSQQVNSKTATSSQCGSVEAQPLCNQAISANLEGSALGLTFFWLAAVADVALLAAAGCSTACVLLSPQAAAGDEA